MRRTATPAITAQMYKHFATLTVACTALVAFFANGEKQQAVAAETATTRPQASSLRPQAELQPSPALQSQTGDDTGSWGDDTAGFGQPAADDSSDSWFSNPFGSDFKARAAARDESSLTDSADGDEPAQAQGGSEGSTGPTAAEIAAAAAASRQRSGASGND